MNNIEDIQFVHLRRQAALNHLKNNNIKNIVMFSEIKVLHNNTGISDDDLIDYYHVKLYKSYSKI